MGKKKQSVFSRFANLTKANLNHLISKAEDPEKMLDQLVREYTNNVVEAERAAAKVLGGLHKLESDLDKAEKAKTDWGAKAELASKKSKEAAKNSTEKADYLDLAKEALRNQIQAEADVARLEGQIEVQKKNAESLKDNLAKMKNELSEVKSKRDDLVARKRIADAQSAMQNAMSDFNVADPTSAISNYEEVISRQEAEVQGWQDLADSSVEGRFKALEEEGQEAELEKRLKALTNS